MTYDFTIAPEEPSTSAKVADGIKTTTGVVSDAIESGRQPGMPLDVLARAVREAPLAALAIAFMVGVVEALYPHGRCGGRPRPVRHGH
jgi:hypothetical protein